MVEIGISGPPFRASSIAVGAALAAEAEGAHAIWYADTLGVDLSAAAWRAGGGPMARVVPDPTDLGDPTVTGVVAALVARRLRVGLLGWNPGVDAARAARTVASLADVAPGRFTVACAGTDAEVTALAGELRDALDIELARYAGTPDVAARLGWGWIAVAQSPTATAKLATDAGVTETVGVHVPVVVHADAGVVRDALAAPLLQSFGINELGDGAVTGRPSALDHAIDEYVAAGVTRIILENLLPFGAPTEMEASQVALRTSVRSARLRHRVVS